jgi:hypothetical protein
VGNAHPSQETPDSREVLVERLPKADLTAIGTLLGRYEWDAQGSVESHHHEQSYAAEAEIDHASNPRDGGPDRQPPPRTGRR